MAAPEGTLNLIMNNEIDDTQSVKYEQDGNDLIRINQRRSLMVHEAGVGFVELLDSDGLIIATAAIGKVDSLVVVNLKTLRAVKPMVIK